MGEKEPININGVQYVPYVPPAEVNPTPVVVEPSKFMKVLRNPQFWMAFAGSCFSLLLREDFASLPWNIIVGQVGTLWMSAAFSFGLLDKVSKNASTPAK